MRSIRFSRLPKCITGFSLVELLVVVTILGIFSSLAVGFSIEEIRRNKINAAAQQMAGWLEAAQRAAQRGIGCYVTVNALTAASEQDTIATSEIDTAVGTLSTSITNHCSNIGIFKIETGSANQKYYVEVTPTNAFVFTPRGSVFNPTSTNGTFSSNLRIKFSSSESGAQSLPAKCVQIIPPFGSAEVISC